MDELLIIIQVISVIILGLVGFLSKTFNHIKKKVTAWGWVLLFIVSTVLLITSWVKESKTKQYQEKLDEKIDTLTKAIFEIRTLKVMEAPKDTTRSPIPQASNQITITSPLNNSQIPARTYVEGKVFDPKTKVWVVIRSLETSSYWVQPEVNVKEDGTWTVMAYFGRIGSIDKGKHFEIIVIGNPKDKINEGDILSRWPEAQWSSQVIEVIRE